MTGIPAQWKATLYDPRASYKAPVKNFLNPLDFKGQIVLIQFYSGKCYYKVIDHTDFRCDNVFENVLEIYQ